MVSKSTHLRIVFLLLLCFCDCHTFIESVGVDFKIKFLTVADKKLKLTIWDTGKDFPVILIMT